MHEWVIILNNVKTYIFITNFQVLLMTVVSEIIMGKTKLCPLMKKNRFSRKIPRNPDETQKTQI